MEKIEGNERGEEMREEKREKKRERGRRSYSIVIPTPQRERERVHLKVS